MGSSFFKGQKGLAAPGPGIGGQRTLTAGQYAARGSAIGAQKALAQAMAANKGAYKGPLKRSAAYPPGPKV